jgi:hypothetical protein
MPNKIYVAVVNIRALKNSTKFIWASLSWTLTKLSECWLFMFDDALSFRQNVSTTVFSSIEKYTMQKKKIPSHQTCDTCMEY